MFHNPVNVIKVNNWLEQYKHIAKDLNLKCPLLVTSKGNLKRNNLDSQFDSDSVFFIIKPDPNFESCSIAIDYVKDKKYDGIIAIGGGSVMDTAKVINAAISSQIFDLKKLINYKKKYIQKIPSIFIPTTHGTGSEVTMWGTIWDNKGEKKYSISNIGLYPDYAILDPSLTKSLPLTTSLITTLDALSHSFEAIWNKNANNVSTRKAIKSICLILMNIRAFKADSMNLSMRKKLLEASNYAGLAFSNTMTAAAHSISYPLTIHHNIQHGIAASLSLCSLLDLNREYIEAPLTSIYESLNISFEDLKTLIKDIPKGVLPFNLKELGVPKEAIDRIAKESFFNSRIKNNIRDLNHSDVIKILYDIY